MKLMIELEIEELEGVDNRIKGVNNVDNGRIG
jgi:hypothetical protein